jgi:hypothetical protein
VKIRKLGFNTSNADLSIDILDIMNKPDVVVWNKTIRKQDISRTRRLNIGLLNQNLIREDKNIVIDSANKSAVADIIISGTKVTDKVGL